MKLNEDNPSFPLISIVITTKNEEKNIERCLQSIRCQTYPADRIEIIVVDNASSDNTKLISQKYTDHVYDRGPERSAQRNYGMIEKSTGSYVMDIDADMILSPSLISVCVIYFSITSFLALHIKEIILGAGFWSKVRRFERSFYDGTVIDGARIFRKEVFVRVRGFDEKLWSGEDWDIDKKVKQLGSIGLLPFGSSVGQPGTWELADFVKSKGVNPESHSAVIYHNESDFHLVKYFRKKAYYTKGFSGYIKNWGSKESDIKKQLGIWYRYVNVFIEHGKWKKMLAQPHLLIGMYVLRGCVGVIYLTSKMRKGMEKD
jgi:glycosyltransferase involved in cell wall biosynthesis